MNRSPGFSFVSFTLALALGVLGALSLAFADTAPSAAPDAGPSMSASAALAPAPSPKAADGMAAAQSSVTVPGSFASGHSPLPANAKVPVKWLPAGAFDPDTGPSVGIYPPQSLTIRFNHKLHQTKVGTKCTTCHKAALTSQSAQDHLVPNGTTCDDCHGTDHANTNAVKAGDRKSHV